jgi:hypothetical protein
MTMCHVKCHKSHKSHALHGKSLTTAEDRKVLIYNIFTFCSPMDRSYFHSEVHPFSMQRKIRMSRDSCDSCDTWKSECGIFQRIARRSRRD